MEMAAAVRFSSTEKRVAGQTAPPFKRVAAAREMRTRFVQKQTTKQHNKFCSSSHHPILSLFSLGAYIYRPYRVSSLKMFRATNLRSWDAAAESVIRVEKIRTAKTFRGSRKPAKRNLKRERSGSE